jgi:hypothetical protein
MELQTASTAFVLECLGIQMVHCHVPNPEKFFGDENVLIDTISLINLKINLFVGRVIGGCCWTS